MKVILSNNELDQAIIEYLAKRGIDTKSDQIVISAHSLSMSVRQGMAGWSFEATVSDIELPPKEGPYR
jgi:hypothetical protein